MKEAPESIIWIITAKCNLNCLHCYTKRFLSKSELSTDVVLKLLKEAADAGVEYIQFTGGEPLLLKDIFKVINTALDYGIEVSLFTNSTLVNEELAKKISRSGITVFTSIDGPNKEIHERIRGLNTWERVVRGIKYLVNEGIDLHINVSISKHNWSFIGDTIRKAVEIGANSVSVIPVMPSGNALLNKVYIDSDEAVMALKQVEEAAKELGIVVSAWCMPFSYLVVSPKYVSSYSCRDWDVMDIAPSGDVLLCDILDIVLGNVAELGIRDSWRKLMNSKIMSEILNPEIKEPCSSCPIMDLCKTGCYARALKVLGSHKLPDPLCPLVKNYLKPR